MSEFLTIGELARRTGVTTSALRYCDELGLVRPTQRVCGQRRNAAGAVTTVGVVRCLQEAGFTLAETKRLIPSRRRSPVAWRALAVRKSDALRHRIAREEAARQAIELMAGIGHRARLRAFVPGPSGDGGLSRPVHSKWLAASRPRAIDARISQAALSPSSCRASHPSPPAVPRKAQTTFSPIYGCVSCHRRRNRPAASRVRSVAR